MERPTALIRRLLIAEAIQGYMTSEISLIKEQMRTDGIKIIDRKDNVHDVWIQYLNGKQNDEAIFMNRMLEAEAKNRAKRTGIISWPS